MNVWDGFWFLIIVLLAIPAFGVVVTHPELFMKRWQRPAPEPLENVLERLHELKARDRKRQHDDWDRAFHEDEHICNPCARNRHEVCVVVQDLSNDCQCECLEDDDV